MLALTHASVKQGFLDYVTSQAIDRLQYLEIAVSDIYADQMSLAPLINNNRLWRRLKYQTFREYVEQQTREALTNNQPPPAPSVKAHERAFIEQLVLTDPDKNLIVGTAFHQAEYYWRALYHEQTLIGYIGYIKPRDFMRSVDRLFVSQQLKAFALFSIAIVLASFLVALIVSRWLVRPLGELSRGAKQIAAGDFSVRIKPESGDELGMLCHHFNDLANTLSANEQARKQWVADISHEMRTPLSVLKGQIEAMEDGIRPSSPENLALLRDKVNALSSLINDLYELSLSDLGALSYTKSPVSLKRLVDTQVRDYKHRLASKGLELRINNQLNPKLMLSCDEKRLNQLFRNLFENNLRYTDAPGEVQLCAEQIEQTVVITLDDSAPTIAADQLERIFERLYRVETSRNRATGGAGLGLSICRNIVEAHRGSIIASQSSLGGLRITVTLPLEA